VDISVWPSEREAVLVRILSVELSRGGIVSLGDEKLLSVPSFDSSWDLEIALEIGVLC
jgi:hypothetical protein